MNYKLLALLFFTSIPFYPQSSIENALDKGLSSINEYTARNYITILAHDSLLGREAATSGGLKAAHYLKSIFEEVGLKPWKGGFFQPFSGSILTGTSRNNPDMQNVLAYIPGKKADEIVIIGAHYDHLGIKGSLNKDTIYNGADDNASGTSAVLQVAKAFVESGKKPDRTVIFALWDGEEKGLLGSSFFVEDHYSHILTPLVEPIPIKAYINLDMIGRNDNNRLDSLSHVKSTIAETNPEFAQWINEDIENHGLNLSPEFFFLEKDSKRKNTDHAPFWKKGIPFIAYNTGLHSDYHKASDHSNKINYEKVTNVTKLAFLNLWRMANKNDF